MVRNVEFLINSMSTQRDHTFKELGCAYWDELDRILLEVHPSISIAEFVHLFEHDKQIQDVTFYSVRGLRVHPTFLRCSLFLCASRNRAR